ncbi:hypothetical protein MVEG_02467 [Podila verticillata NRRL 6337]|nr:hypothetical protein MVEG_02467 [Podila verticillata NRRL 6337]
MSSPKWKTLVCVLDNHPLSEAVELVVPSSHTGHDLKTEIKVRMADKIDSCLTDKQLVAWWVAVDPDTADKETLVSARDFREMGDHPFERWRRNREKIRSKRSLELMLPEDTKIVIIVRPRPHRQHVYVVLYRSFYDDWKRPETYSKVKRVFEHRQPAYRYAFETLKAIMEDEEADREHPRLSPTAFTTDLLDDIEGDLKDVQTRLEKLSWKTKFNKITALYTSMLLEPTFTWEPNSDKFSVVKKHVCARH